MIGTGYMRGHGDVRRRCMMRIHRAIVMTALALAVPARADWRAANPGVTEAAKDPRVAAALAAATRIDEAAVAGDTEAFISLFAPDARVNNPFNTVATPEMARRLMASGVITPKYLHRSIEYAGPRRDDEVVLMGEETYEPPTGTPQAGKTVRRRFTDVWRLQNGKWKLSLRQATVFVAK